jgi:amino acid transporter
MPARRPSSQLVCSSASAAIALPLLLRLSGRGWLVDALAGMPGSRAVNFTLGFICTGGWYTIPLVAVIVYRRRDRKPPFFWPWWLFLALGALALLTLPTRRSSDYNDGLASRVPGFTDGALAGTIPLLVGGLLLWAASGWSRLRRAQRRRK